MSQRLLLALGGAALLVAVVLAVVLTGREDRPGTAAAGSGTSAGATRSSAASTAATQGPVLPSSAPAASSAGPTTPATTTAATTTAAGAADQRPAELSPVPLDAGATVPGVVSGRLVAVEAVQATGSGVGNVSGPALRVTVELTGGGPELSLDGSYVELLTGPDLAPASPVDDPSVAPLQGRLAAGGTATGVYVFSVDDGARGDVTVRVQPAPGEPFLVFRGAAG
ncbi:hypothetical protein [Klenkia brasiliensis]|uniref:DUF4352 domain-containing protein n=1 Tax=Klenkia brasiliensis TaxID=333142 RepID=A0A1G7LPP7_9ACTN|nr:hypothetical protein [Klenkia brasiliensis]SDF51497.1 hypothetical protein SAMN05660324_0347 [Klenkia brasiliensis]